MSKIFGILVAVFFISPMAHADCVQANLASQDDVKISLHYSSCNISDGNSATVSPTVHVILPPSKCPAQFVYATLITSQYGYSRSQQVQLFQSPNYVCGFDSASPVQVQQGYEGIAEQQIAISFESDNNWEWAMDPVTQSHNFGYNFESGYCGGPQGQTPETCN